MGTLKLTSWNAEYLDRLLATDLSAAKIARRDAIVREIFELNPDVLCLLEGPKGETSIDLVATQLLRGEYVAVKAPDGEYRTQGIQWIWFLVKAALAPSATLLPAATWDEFAGAAWDVHFWGDFSSARHRHYRHPQVLILDWDGLRVECIGLHLKSKFVNQGESMWYAGGTQQETFIREALRARIKLATEAQNVRAYIDKKFEQVANPAIFVMGDLNDGPGKEYFEQAYLFFDLLSGIQGDVFFARRFLNHALFDYPEALRWTVAFQDFVQIEGQPPRDPHILLDHIMFTQGLVDGSLPLEVKPKAGLVEHEVHELINAALPSNAQTSDHAPVSCIVSSR